MIFLLPPSETKAVGGLDQKLDLGSLAFAELLPARKKALSAVADVAIKTGPTMAAINRYTGTLYSAIHGRGLKGTPAANNQLTEEQLNRAEQLVFIQSALFGLISATDLIPSYKVSPTKNIEGVSPKKLWAEAHGDVWQQFKNQLVIDLRSKAYAELAPISETPDSYSVEVFFEAPDGTRTAMNHFNKKAKGQLVRAALSAKTPPTTIADLKKLAKTAGLKLEQTGQSLTLITVSNN